jgi:pyrimidine deaminase RibD-like protein
MDKEKLEPYMKIAIEEAEQSLREGNHGFGAVIVKNNAIIAQAHDTEVTDRDPTSHAEINAIKLASSRVGPDLAGCILLSTHEPCPMCSAAIIRARIRTESGLLQEKCAVLYNKAVREELRKLQGAGDEQLQELNEKTAASRSEWYLREKSRLALGDGDAIDRGYRLLLHKLGIPESEAPIVHRDKESIVFHSKNFCPTLETCRILRLDTRRICRLRNEGATDQLVRQIDSNLRFSRNYEKIRPYSAYCEECIETTDNRKL